MTVDETGLEYECRACGRKKSTRKQMVQHVNSMSDANHRGRDIDDLIMPVYPDVMPEDSSGSSYKDIVEAFKRIKSGKVKEYGPSIKQEEINHVSNLSGWPTDKITRVLKDERIPYTKTGQSPQVYFDDLSHNNREILAYIYHGKYSTQRELAEEIGSSQSSISEVKNRKGWLLEDRFRPEEVDNWFKEDVDVDVDGMIQQMRSKTKDEIEKDERSTPEDDMVEQIVEQMEQAGSNGEHHDIYAVSGADAMYEHLEALILNGNEERARVMFNHILND